MAVVRLVNVQERRTPMPIDSLIGKLYSTEELAEELGKSVRTVELWRWSGKGPPWIKIGREVAYREEDVVRWMGGLVQGRLTEKGMRRKAAAEAAKKAAAAAEAGAKHGSADN